MNVQAKIAKIEKIYKKKQTKTLLNTEAFSTIYDKKEEEKEKKEEEAKETKEGMEGQDQLKEMENNKPPDAEAVGDMLGWNKFKEKVNRGFQNLAEALDNTKRLSRQQLDENGLWLQNVFFEFFLVFFSYIISYNIYYFSFLYHWEVKTAHYDPEQGFLFGGVLKDFMDEWIMRDIRYPMLFMSYIYSWLIPKFFTVIGVISYPKLCFIIILLHTMIIAFTQGPNAAMSVQDLIGGSPSSLLAFLNVCSCISSFFSGSIKSWLLFVALWWTRIIANIIRFIIALIGVFISQFMVYCFFIYTTSGIGLLWEGQFFGVGKLIQEIEDHIGGKAGVGKNYCKTKGDTIGLWGFINGWVEPYFSWLFTFLLALYIVVKMIATFYHYHGQSGKLIVCSILGIIGVLLWIIVTTLFISNYPKEKGMNTVFVSSTKEPEEKESINSKLLGMVQGLSEYRKKNLTVASNQANNFLSKTVGDFGRSINNPITTVLGKNLFSKLNIETQKTLEEITPALNSIVNNIDSREDSNSNGAMTKQAEEDIKQLVTNNVDIYSTIASILTQPGIEEFIQKKLKTGSPMQTVLSNLFLNLLSSAGANPKVASLVSNVFSDIKQEEQEELGEEELGEEEPEEGEELREEEQA